MPHAHERRAFLASERATSNRRRKRSEKPKKRSDINTILARTLVRGGTHDGRWVYDELTDARLHHDLFDHPVFFREHARPYRAAAIVGQPYKTATASADARATAAKIGLALHVPPKETASWWYPGSTRFFCLTRPEVARVQFLPEQMEATGEKS